MKSLGIKFDDDDDHVAIAFTCYMKSFVNDFTGDDGQMLKRNFLHCSLPLLTRVVTPTIIHDKIEISKPDGLTLIVILVALTLSVKLEK